MKLGAGSSLVHRKQGSSYLSKQLTSGSSFLAFSTANFLKLHRCSLCMWGVCVSVYTSVYTHRRTHIGNVIPESISVLDGLGLPKRPFKRKLLKDDYRIETPSFKSARGKLL